MWAVFVLALMGGLLGLGLAYAADLLKVEADPRIEGVRERLPGYDCGACSYPGCSAFAEAIVEGDVKDLKLCKPGNNTHYDAIVDYLNDNRNPDGSKITVKK